MKGIVEEMRKRFFKIHTSNIIVEPINTKEFKLIPLMVVRQTPNGLTAESFKMKEQQVEDVLSFDEEIIEERFYLRVFAKDGILTVISQEETDEYAYWIEILFVAQKR